jgi:predicted enzyme related to lactoylglutathione lyase
MVTHRPVLVAGAAGRHRPDQDGLKSSARLGVEAALGYTFCDAMFEQLDFIYQPSRDAAGDVEHYTETFGAEPVFAIERFGTRVAMVRLTPDSPGLLFAEHLAGDQAILIFRVANLEEAIAEITNGGGQVGGRFEMPYGVGAQLITPGPQRLAIYEATHAERGRSIVGRRDF